MYTRKAHYLKEFFQILVYFLDANGQYLRTAPTGASDNCRHNRDRRCHATHPQDSNRREGVFVMLTAAMSC